MVLVSASFMRESDKPINKVAFHDIANKFVFHYQKKL